MDLSPRDRRLIDYALCFLSANADEEECNDLQSDSVTELVTEIHELAHRVVEE